MIRYTGYGEWLIKDGAFVRYGSEWATFYKHNIPARLLHRKWPKATADQCRELIRFIFMTEYIIELSP